MSWKSKIKKLLLQATHFRWTRTKPAWRNGPREINYKGKENNTHEMKAYETNPFKSWPQEMIWPFEYSFGICKWRKHKAPVCINLAKENSMPIYKIVGTVPRLILHWKLSSLLSRNVLKFLHWFSLAKGKQPQKLSLEVMTERLHQKSEGWYHVSLWFKKKKKKTILLLFGWFEMLLICCVLLSWLTLYAN